MKKETPKRLTSALCSCAINKKLSTPYDFYVCDVISKERVKRIHLCSSCRLRKTRKGGITFVPSVSGINEITFLFGANLFADQSLPKKGKKNDNLFNENFKRFIVRVRFIVERR